MKVLLAIARFDYGNPANGDSYELTSWYGPLVALGHELSVFDTFDPRWARDPETTGRALQARVSEEAPELVMMMLMEKEVPMRVIEDIRRTCPIINWFADDTWRYFAYSRHIAPHFSWVVTASRKAEAGYRRSGTTAIFSPWGYDPATFHPVDVTPTIDVGFVGQRHGRRERIINRLRAEGIDVEARGAYWPEGRIDTAELAERFASTRINLSFLESSAGPLLRLGVKVRGATRADRLLTRFVNPPRQLKARPFEITACRAFLLTNTVVELGDSFDLEHEVGTFRTERDLKERIVYFLDHPAEREAIARRGWDRSKAYSWQTILSRVVEDPRAGNR